MERLDKFLCDSGAGSRSQVKVILKSGRVTVDGKPEKDGSRKIDASGCEICLDGQRLGGMRRAVVMLNKPAGYVTATEDPVEKLGVERTERALAQAQLILAVYDGTEALFERDIEEIDGCPVIAVVNKEDLGVKLDVETLKKHFKVVITVSAATGEGVDELRGAIAQALRLHEIVPDGTMVTNPRQAEVLSRACTAVKRAADALRMGMTPDMVLADSEEAVSILGELTGRSTTEDVLGAIFSRFCVGK